jgi:hypothetical protein
MTTWTWTTQGDGLFVGGALDRTQLLTQGIVIPAGSSIQRVIARGELGLFGSCIPGPNVAQMSPYLVELHYYLTGVQADRKPVHDTEFAVKMRSVVMQDGTSTPRVNFYGDTGPIYFDAEVRKLSPPPPAPELILNWEVYIQPVLGVQSQNTVWMSQSYGYLWTQYLVSTPG